MVEMIKHFFAMGGYGFYIWSSYSCVAIFFIAHWLLPWRKWRQYVRLLEHAETLNANK